MAIFAAVHDLGVRHIITSRIEHHAVGHTVEAFEGDMGIRVSYVEIDGQGHVNLEDLERLLQTEDKTLVSLMHANNEIGTLLPIRDVSRLCRKYQAYFHSDTVQSIAHYALNLSELDIDFITCSAHKFHGPKGVGFLYVNKATRIGSLIHGGSQERGLRGGTENIYGIVGLSKAMDLAYEAMDKHQRHIQGLKDHMIEAFKAHFPDVCFHGDITPENSLYTVLNVCFPKTEKASMLLFSLDLKGVAVSGGSACTSGATKGSHVLEGIGADMSRPNARFSFSRYTTLEEVDYAIEQVKSLYSIALA